jgi:hypothetical protein
MADPTFPPGWLERDVARASKRADELRSEAASTEALAAEKRLDDAIAEAFDNGDPIGLWFAVRVYVSEIRRLDERNTGPSNAGERK